MNVDHECLVPLQTNIFSHSHRTCTKASTSFICSCLMCYFCLNIAYGTNLSCSTFVKTSKCIGVNEHMIKSKELYFNIANHPIQPLCVAKV